MTNDEARAEAKALIKRWNNGGRASVALALYRLPRMVVFYFGAEIGHKAWGNSEMERLAELLNIIEQNSDKAKENDAT